MATTYTLISSNVLTSSAASITFSSIPATYTDLVVRASVRGFGSGSPTNTFFITLNGFAFDTTLFSRTTVYGTGSTASSDRTSSYGSISVQYMDAETATANTFSNIEIYIPSYLVAQNKPSSVFAVSEQNSTTNNGIEAIAGLWRSNSAVNSIVFEAGSSLASGSSFYLYGISNA